MFDKNKETSILGTVLAVRLSKKHTYSKENQEIIKLVNITFHWKLSQIPEQAVKKHCKMCGKLSVFTDTNVRRHNQTEKAYTNMRFINAKKIIRGTKKLSKGERISIFI